MEDKDKNKTDPNQLWLYRQKRGYTQREVAMLLGERNTSNISKYERGRRPPSLETALKLGIALSTPVEFLFGDLYSELKQEIQPRREKLFRELDD